MKTHLMLISLECWPQNPGEWFGGNVRYDAPESAFLAEQQRKEYGCGVPCWIQRAVY